MMKARHYDRRFFSRGIHPNIIAIADGANVDKESMGLIANGNCELEKDIVNVCLCLENSSEFGSILDVPNIDFERIKVRETLI